MFYKVLVNIRKIGRVETDSGLSTHSDLGFCQEQTFGKISVNFCEIKEVFESSNWSLIVDLLI